MQFKNILTKVDHKTIFETALKKVTEKDLRKERVEPIIGHNIGRLQSVAISAKDDLALFKKQIISNDTYVEEKKKKKKKTYDVDLAKAAFQKKSEDTEPQLYARDLNLKNFRKYFDFGGSERQFLDILPECSEKFLGK